MSADLKLDTSGRNTAPGFRLHVWNGWVLLVCPVFASAQTANPGLGLEGLEYANDVERAAAVANQGVFDRLDVPCNPGGIFDTQPEPIAPPPGTTCNGDTFFVYLNARELVQTANEIRGSGASVASLGLDIEGLGKALRWTAAEEFAVQSSMATEFSNGQLSNLAARLSALRFGAGGAGIASRIRWPLDDAPLYASLQPGANADAGSPEPSGDGSEPRESFSPWGGFVNAGFGYGSKAPTSLENAFDFDGSELTFGADYRFAGDLVVGGIIGLTDQAVDFDEAASSISVVDGYVDAEGRSLMLFAFLQNERLYVGGSIGAQSIDYDIRRDIKYPSFNPDVSSANSTAMSHPDSDAVTATFGAGYGFGGGRFSVEPGINVEYVDVAIDSFAEQRSINRLSDATGSKRFDLSVAEQKFRSLDVAVGVRMQYVFTPTVGVFVPFLAIDAHRELEDNARVITAGYAAIQHIPELAAFTVPTDEPDDAYAVTTLGLSMVLRGGRQRQLDGPIAGGLSAFLHLRRVSGLRYYEDTVAAGGFRYEF